MYNINNGGIMSFLKKRKFPLTILTIDIIIVVIVLSILFSGCASTAGLGKRLLKAKIVSEENKGALAICTRANALMYGGGNIAVIKTAKDFQGTVEVKKGCAVKITARKANNDTTQNPNNPAEELLDKMFNNPGELIAE